LETSECAGCEKLQNKYNIYFLLRHVALQSFLLVKANVPKPWELISTKTRRLHVLPLLLDAFSDCLIHRRCAGIHAIYVRRTRQNYANMLIYGQKLGKGKR
jgi:hypothetical protein